MNLAFALDYIPRRMREMGFGENYLTRHRQMLVTNGTTLEISGYNQFWYFIEPDGLKIESERGIYNMDDVAINIQQHEHSGKIKVLNESGRDMWVLFIQVIPQHSKTKKA